MPVAFKADQAQLHCESEVPELTCFSAKVVWLSYCYLKSFKLCVCGNLKLLGNVEQVCLCCTVFNFFIAELCSGMEKALEQFVWLFYCCLSLFLFLFSFPFSFFFFFFHSFFYFLFLFSFPIFIFFSFFSPCNLAHTATTYVRLKRQKISRATHWSFHSTNFPSCQPGPKQAWNLLAWWCLTLPAVYAVTVTATSRVVSLSLHTSLSTLKNV